MAITRPGLLVETDGGEGESGSHDAAYGRAHVPYGEEGAATYSKITLGCFDVVMKARDMIDNSIQALDLSADSSATVRIADFGSADGGPLMPMVTHIRDSIPAGCELEVRREVEGQILQPTRRIFGVGCFKGTNELFQTEWLHNTPVVYCCPR